MIDAFRVLRDALSWLFRRGAPPDLTTRGTADLPEELEHGVIYLVGEAGFNWKVGLLCPCGCQGVIQLNLVPPGPPLWRARQYRDRTLTLSPSVWRNVGCYSHFWVRRGRVLWVGRGEAPPEGRWTSERWYG